MRRKDIDRLTLQVAKLDQERRERTLVVDETKLNAAEQEFCAVADRRGKRLLRNGWPDFMMLDPETGGMVAVEVKTDADSVSEAQARMFEALESHGMRVMIWSPERPGTLIHWRKHDIARRRAGRRWQLAPQGPRLPGHRRSQR